MKKMNVILMTLGVLALASCGKSTSTSNDISNITDSITSGSSSSTTDTSADTDNETTTVDFELPTLTENSEYKREEDILIDLANKTITNNNGYVAIDSDALYILASGTYTLSGDYNGRVVISGEDAEVELILNGVSIQSDTYAPIVGYNLGDLKITAKKATENTVSDLRTTEGSFNSAIYADCDLDLKGKGTLNITSSLNNGIHTKDDLKIKNLTLNVTAPNNAIKGNDSVTIEEANVLAISSSGDAIKTTNSDISSKGNQRGTVTINGGTVKLYAAFDGIDASYDVVITNSPNLTINTDSYSEYSSEISNTQTSNFYLRLDNNITNATITATLSDGSTKTIKGTSISSGFGRSYLSFALPSDITSYKITATVSGTTYQTDNMNLNTRYDCIYISLRNGNLLTSYETYQTTTRPGIGGPGGMGGHGGMNDGNSNKSDYSSKGIKADNTITIDSGDIVISSHDDGINATNKIEDAYIYFKSGTVYVNASGDGLDSNGYIVMTGGNVIAIGPADGGNGVLDFDNTFKMTGGNLLLAGCSGMDQKPTLASGVSGSVMRQSNTYGRYLTLTVDSKLTLELYVSKNNINYIIYAGYGKSSSVSINSTSSFSGNIYGVA